MIRIIIEILLLLAATSYVGYSLWWILFSKEGIIELWKNDESE
ncbi:hypothetical protein [uncultured Draconibacterium sp.]